MMIINVEEMYIWGFSQDAWSEFSKVPFAKELNPRFDAWIADTNPISLAEIAEYWGFEKIGRQLRLSKSDVKNGRKWFALGINGHVTEKYHFNSKKEELEHIMDECLNP